MDGLYVGAWLIFLACSVIDLLSGNFARAGAVIVVWLIIGLVALCRWDNKRMDKRRNVERLRKYYPELSDAELKMRVENHHTGGDIMWAIQEQERQKMEEEIRAAHPGMDDTLVGIEMKLRSQELLNRTLQRMRDER